jgi:hypothetical protein
MTRLEVAGAAAAFLILGAITAVVRLRWLPGLMVLALNVVAFVMARL